jgi:pimeloyl-ACP methyl ester carboxylesterase
LTGLGRVLLLAGGGLLAFVALVLGLGALATLVIARVVEARYPPAGRSLEVAGGRLAIVEAGPPASARGTVVLLHGASSNSADMMTGLGRRLAADGFRVVAFDRPGYGWSDRVAGSQTPDGQGRAVAQALDRLGIERAIVVGHSWSGALALELALDHPRRVGGLLLLAPVTHPWPGGAVSPVYETLGVRWLGHLLAWTLTAPAGALLFDGAVAAVFAPQAPIPGYAEAAALPLILRPGSFYANAQDVLGLHAFVTRQSPRHGEIRVPTVIVAGDADPVVHTELHAARLAREVEGARLVVLPGVGHMLHQTEPDTIVAEAKALAARLGDHPD